MFNFPTIKFSEGYEGYVSFKGISFVKKSSNILMLSDSQEICQFVLRTDGVVDMVDCGGKWLIPVGHIHPILGHFVSSLALENLITIAHNANYLNTP